MVEADYDLTVDHCGRCRLRAQPVQLLQELVVLGDVLLGELHAALRQKLRLLVAGLSHGLRVDHHVDLGHAHLLSSFAALRSNSRLGIVTAITPTASVGPWAAHFTASPHQASLAL